MPGAFDDRVERIFDAVRAAPRAERAAALDEQCGTDGELRREVASLLEQLDDEPGFLESAAPGASDLGRLLDDPRAASAPVKIGDRIDGYRIDGRLGEGAFGVVYRAQQLEPVTRTVAIKILKPGMDSAPIVARFEAERQALALMDHPGIARVYDAGLTDRALPYFVMEHVDGVAITNYADTRRLDVDARLDLFLMVTDAIEHAHQKGVLHRDLKPSNILVADRDGQPAPRVIDFGIAKAMGARLTDHTIHTGVGQVLGTLEYMSPEQATIGQARVDTRADIYALGVLLYELLTGVLPIDPADLHTASFSDLPLRLRDLDPERPSVRRLDEGCAARCGLDPAALRRRLRGDLDWIVMKAIEKDPDRRYPSTDALAADLRRHRRDVPVGAGPPSRRYRIGKFVRRHRALVASGLVAATILVGGMAGTSWQAWRAARAQRHAEAMNGFVRAIVGLDDPFAPDSPEERLDRSAARVSELLGSVPAAEVEGRVLLSRAYAGQGLHEKSMVQIRDAMEIAEGALPEDDPLTVACQIELALGLRQIDAYDEAIPLLESASHRAIESLGPDDKLTLRCRSNLALFYKDVGRRDEADTVYTDTLERLVTHIGLEDDLTLNVMSNLATLRRSEGRTDVAMELMQTACSGYERMYGPEHSLTLVAKDQLGTLLRICNRPVEAEAMHRAAYDAFERKLGPMHDDTVAAMYLLGQAVLDQGRAEDAETILRDAFDRLSRSVGPEHRFALLVQRALAQALCAQGRGDEALVYAQRVHDGFRSMVGDDHLSTLAGLLAVARAQHVAGRPAEAEPAFEEAVQRSRDMETLHEGNARLRYGMFLLEEGRLDEADEHLHAGHDLIRQTTNEQHRLVFQAREALLAYYVARGDTDRADAQRALMRR